MEQTEIIFRLHRRSDTERLVSLINRDPFHLLNGISVEKFEQSLDTPEARTRENTYLVETRQTIVGFFSLSFSAKEGYLFVDCFGTVDASWRRRGIGTKIFEFILDRLKKIGAEEAKQIHFKHRALSCIPGEERLGENFGLKEQSVLEVLCLKDLRDIVFSQPARSLGFRSSTIEEAVAWAKIYNEAFNENRTIESVEHEFKGAGLSNSLYLLCEDEYAAPIGIFAATVNGSLASIATIAVSRNWQNQGVGKALLSEGLRRLRDCEVLKVRLAVDTHNETAKSLYTKLGFVFEYKRTNFVITQ